ncbi:hypothetical protein ODS41_07485 [Pyrobaculum sp. 3827-6]|uniref:hypothetical protein n=1 Tax=Pyrobaculum sp. 3827-6 TaxID=2983604 RepID=UPI0021DA2669|nr:hypothetical protein [Pyrobaculum sp. 3827-6]MCU7787753.1 hypothetical protein [Pyrobaculum sp. 3827-6]
MAGTRILAAVSGAVALAASLIYTLTVTRRLPTQDLALLTLYNSAYAVATAVVGYATTWYPRVLAKDPSRLPELAAAGILVALAAAIPLAAYLALYGRLDPVLLALGATSLVLFAWPAGAYIAVYRQRLSVAANFASQLVKIGGAYAVRQSPTAYVAIAVTALMLLPAAVAKRAKPNFRRAIPTVVAFLRGAPYQTLFLATTAAGGLVTYAILLAGGDKLLSYNFILFQISKSVYPALAIVPLMYGSLLTEKDKTRRALIDGAVLLYLYLLAAAVMAKTPQWYIALLRPTELNSELIEAVRLNAAALVASGIYLHADTTLKGLTEKEIFSLKDPPAKALLLDLVTAPINTALTYALAKSLGAPGMVLAQLIILATIASYRIQLLGVHAKQLITQLYLPSAITLIAIYLTPMPLFPFASKNLIDTITTYIPNLVILALVAGGYMLALSRSAREAATTLLRKATRQI